MSLNKYILIVLILFMETSFYGQIRVPNENPNGNAIMPQESIFVHYNTSVLLAGEALLYKIYCLNQQTNRLSNLSKIAYIELVGNDKTIVFKHKIRLDSGLGEGDFFIPTSVQSGSYKLIAYTQWMRNMDNTLLFQSTINIINPYQKNPKIIQANSAADSTILKQSKSVVQRKINNRSNFIQLRTNKKDFSQREKVTLHVDKLNSTIPFGHYSVSVRKVSELGNALGYSSTNYRSLYQKSTGTKKLDSIFLPELRGELISGKIIHTDSKLPSANTNVGLSIPGINPIFIIANTNNSGVFHFNIAQEYDSKEATIQIINEEREKLEISLIPLNSINYDNIIFDDFKISPELEKLIVQNSIYNQIENAYLTTKQNTDVHLKPNTVFFNSKAEEYLLDDYTRFPSVKETMIEVIDQVFISQRNGLDKFNVRGFGFIDPDVEPMVLVDGLLIQNHDDIIGYSAKKIHKISFVRGKYNYSTKVYNGILSIETIKSDYKNFYAKEHIMNVDLFKPLVKKNYFYQDYSVPDKYNRIPDYRNQLLWLPTIDFHKKDNTITFFTSDISGQFEIRLEGFTSTGKPVSVSEIINVN